MDKRTSKGKKFSKLQTHEEKMLFLLEGIYDEVKSTRYGILSKMSDSDSILKKILETNIQIMEVTNTDKFWPDDKINKEMLYKKHVLGNEIKIKQAQKTIEVLKTTRDEWKNRYEQESEKNTTLTKVIDRLSEKLEQLQVEVDDGDKNPLSS